MTDLELAEEIERDELVILALTVQPEIKAQIIAALRRGPPSEPTMQIQGLSYRAPERPPSGEMAEIREILEWARALLKNIVKASPEVRKYTDVEAFILNEINPAIALTAKLSAAEAEVRKSCPLCGRTDPHSHTSGPLGMS